MFDMNAIRYFTWNEKGLQLTYRQKRKGSMHDFLKNMENPSF
jgi:hypothetical protein